MTEWSRRLENPVSARLRDPAVTGYLALVLAVLASFLAIPPIEAHPAQLSQVWMNLLSNALDAVERRAHPEIRVAARLCSVGGNADSISAKCGDTDVTRSSTRPASDEVSNWTSVFEIEASTLAVVRSAGDECRKDGPFEDAASPKIL